MTWAGNADYQSLRVPRCQSLVSPALRHTSLRHYVSTSLRRYVATSLTCITPGRVARAVRLRNQLPDTAYGPFSSNTCHFTDKATVTKELKT